MTFITGVNRVVVECTENEYKSSNGTVIQSNIAHHIVGTHKGGWSWNYNMRNSYWSKEEISNEPSEEEQEILDFFKSIDIKI